MNDKLTTLLAVFMLFFALVFPVYNLIRFVYREIWVWQNRNNRTPAASRLIWAVAHSK